MDLEVYLSTIFDGLEGFVYSPVKTADSWEQNWFEYPVAKGELLEHIRTAQGDVYISPAVYSQKRATKDSIKKIQAVWVEFDGLDKINFKSLSEPSLIVQTSYASHVHCYWKIDPSNLSIVEDVNRRLTYYLQADTSGWDATQLLRPPETTNHKHGLPVVLAHSAVSTYSTSDFHFVPQVSAPPSEFLEIKDILPVGQILAEHQLSLKLVRMIRKELPVEPYRSSFLTRLANELAEEQLSYQEIVSLLKEADDRVGKYSSRTDQLTRLSQLADYAIHKHIAEEEIILYTVEDILNHVEDLDWILPPLLHTTGLMLLSSAPGVGKTQLALQMAYCISEQQRFLGILPNYKMKVLFMSLEMRVPSLKYILNHQREHWNAFPNMIVIDEEASYVHYENLIDERGIGVVVIDSLTEIFDDSIDNPTAEARRVMKWVRKIQRRYGVAVVIIHHNRKATEGNKKPKGLADLAGSFQFGKEADTVLQLWKDTKGMELSGVKVRFGPEFSFPITRDEHLWFTRVGESASNDTATDKPNPPGDSINIGFGHRHGN